MSAGTTTKEPLKRVNTRITLEQDKYIKTRVKESKGNLTEGEVHRNLLDKGISADHN